LETRLQPDVLIVDDDQAMRQILESICELTNVPCRIATDGIHALELVQEFVPCLMILDLSMPRLDGYGVLERLRASPETDTIPVMIYTAHHLTETEQDRLGIDRSMIVKKNEMSLEQLQVMIRQYC
jgi:CheY-like chemotaxis protein